MTDEVKETKGFIHKIMPTSIIIKVSIDPSVQETFDKGLRKEMIKFRGMPAPNSMLIVGAALNLKIQRKNILEAEIDPKIKITKYFGILKSIFIIEKYAIVSNFLENYDITSNLIYMNNLPIPLSELKTNKPVIIIFNGDSILEVNVLSEEYISKFHLENFHISQNELVDERFVQMKDDNQVIHKMIIDNVFINGINKNPNSKEIRKHIGKEVCVFFKNNMLIAEIIVNENKPKNHTLDVQEDSSIEKPENDEVLRKSCMIYSGKSLAKKVKVESNNLSKNSVLSTGDHTQSRGYYTSDIINQIEIEVLPKYARRNNFNNFNEKNLEWFYGENQHKVNNWTFFIGLCEAAYRFPERKVCQVLKKKLLDAMNTFHHLDFEKYFEFLVTLGLKKTEGNYIDILHEMLEINYQYFSPYAQFLFNEMKPRTIANEYNICINIYFPRNNKIKNKFYKPKIPEEFYPIISLYSFDQIYYLIYSKGIMEYDGYNINTMKIGPHKRPVMEWPLIYKIRPEYLKMLDGILELHKYIDDKHKDTEEFRDSNEKIIKALESYNVEINSWDAEEFDTLKTKIRLPLNE
ncbi:hypothetical protein SteCoe_16543 [Stentor coeruleus]|uniref:Uncharacterized protein n=1 Tax=Stentor coeruleus TaxID=5963 RepID=A0A1R2C0Y4_9CILI|nr:hypothetical protein SteCoe_16543 [Stentor coeruleus]